MDTFPHITLLTFRDRHRMETSDEGIEQSAPLQVPRASKGTKDIGASSRSWSTTLAPNIEGPTII